MRKVIVILAIVFLSSMSVHAESAGMMGDQKGQAGHGMMP